MLTRAENELLCRVGAEAPMGRMLRRYWLPALLSEEIAEPGGAPRAVRLLGERLVAFRDDAGRVGVLDEGCPHRGASLVLARNEPCGLRCLYHGWQVDVAGNVLDTPCEPDESDYKNRIKAVAYPVRDVNGVIWTYLGPPDTAPAFPTFAPLTLPRGQVAITKVRLHTNWVQTLEGVIDSAHSDFLHATDIRPAAEQAVLNGASRYADDAAYLRRPSNDKRPRLEAEDTAYGFRYAAIRRPLRDADVNKYVRVTHFVAPFYGLFPAPTGFGHMQAVVPDDDEHTTLYFWQYSFDAPIDEALYRERNLARVGVDLTDNYERIVQRTAAGYFAQDRAAMRAGASWAGVDGILPQDQAVQESMGPIVDRTREHLGTTDVAIIRMRRLMLAAVRRFERGEPPLGLAAPVPYGAIHAEERIVPRETPWQEVGAIRPAPASPAPVAAPQTER